MCEGKVIFFCEPILGVRRILLSFIEVGTNFRELSGLGNEKKFAYLNKNFIFIYKILEKGCVCVRVGGGFFILMHALKKLMRRGFHFVV